jgi:hypothetical protein
MVSTQQRCWVETLSAWDSRTVPVGVISAEEPERPAAVRRYAIRDTPPDGSFDRVAAMAARTLDMPIATRACAPPRILQVTGLAEVFSLYANQEDAERTLCDSYGLSS